MFINPFDITIDDFVDSFLYIQLQHSFGLMLLCQLRMLAWSSGPYAYDIYLQGLIFPVILKHLGDSVYNLHDTENMEAVPGLNSFLFWRSGVSEIRNMSSAQNGSSRAAYR